MTQWRRTGAVKILDLDIECRPLSWYGGDWVSKEITAIGCKFLDDKKVNVWLLGPNTQEEMLVGFLRYYDRADMVTGHFIRGYDLPTINSSLLELGMPPLADKLVQDTKLDLVKQSGLSGSQGNLAAMLGVLKPKVGMNQAKWRAANRLTAEGISETRKRVVGDVLQHIEMREKMIERGLLMAPSIWSSTGRRSTKYTG